MGLMGKAIKVAAGTGIAKAAIDAVSEQISDGEIKIPLQGIQAVHCQKCGRSVKRNARFCPNCGAKIDYIKSQITPEYEIYEDGGNVQANSNSYKQVYPDGKKNNDGSYVDVEKSSEVKKTDKAAEKTSNNSQSSNNKAPTTCPNCGAMIDSFSHRCQYCGYEWHDENETHSARDLAEKLARIDSQRMIWKKQRKTGLESVIGVFTNQAEKDRDKRDNAYERFEQQRIKEKKSLIINYPVPNSKEDIMEFMLLAISSINTQDGDIDEIEEAWISKAEQTYQRAKVVLSGTQDFLTIKNMYDQKMSAIDSFKNGEKNEARNKRKFKFIIIAVGILMTILGTLLDEISNSGNSTFYMISLLGMVVIAVGLFPPKK